MLEFHPAVQDDFNEAIAYYEKAAGTFVADRFETEIRQALAAIAEHPRRFPFYGTSRVFRRVRARRFPFVLVYRELPGVVRVHVI